jgi:acetate kinase
MTPILRMSKASLTRVVRLMVCGLIAVVFTAGIGEHTLEIRGAVCTCCAWLGLRIDSGPNSSNALLTRPPDSAIIVLSVQTDEGLVWARYAVAMVSRRSRTEEGT